MATKVIVIKSCLFQCPLCSNLHTIEIDGKKEIVGNCEGGSADTEEKTKLNMKYGDPIPDWCKLTDLDFYGWVEDE